jgi:hypothetical protein
MAPRHAGKSPAVTEFGLRLQGRTVPVRSNDSGAQSTEIRRHPRAELDVEALLRKRPTDPDGLARLEINPLGELLPGRHRALVGVEHQLAMTALRWQYGAVCSLPAAMEDMIRRL